MKLHCAWRYFRNIGHHEEVKFRLKYVKLEFNLKLIKFYLSEFIS